MKISRKIAVNLAKYISIVSLLTYSSSSFSGELSSVVDDFSDVNTNNLGIVRQFLDDKIAGGNTQIKIQVASGKLHVKGDIVPPRGQPGWASSVLLLNPQGLGQDVSHFSGVRLLIKLDTGSISVSANSAEITNFDYHAAVQSDGHFHEINIPFSTMKRSWSAQTPLNTATISSLSIVAFGLKKTAIDYEIDQIGFY